MINELEVYPQYFEEGQEIADDRKYVWNVHDENGVAALQFPCLFSTSSPNDKPEISNRDKTAEDT